MFNEKPFISIIFPNWNGSKDTLLLIRSLGRLNYPKDRLEIICVDNGSTDSSPDEIEKYFSKMSGFVRLLLHRLPKNIGFAPGLNEGYKKISRDTDFVWRLDNDVVVDPEALNELIKPFQMNENIGVVGSVVYPLFDYNDLEKNEKYKVEIGCRVSFISTNVYKLEISSLELYNMAKRNSFFMDLSYSVGCSNLIDNNLIKKYGFLDPDLFLYYDDTEFSKRISDKGYIVGTALCSKIYHRGSVSTGGIRKPLGIFFTTRSELVFFRKFLSTWHFALYYPLLLVKRLVLATLRVIRKGPCEVIYAIRAVLKAHQYFWLGKYGAK